MTTLVHDRPVAYVPKPPLRNHAQCMDALKHANDIRVERAKMKREIKAGERKIVDVLQSPPEYVLTMKIYDLLLAFPKFGRVKASRTLARHRISQSKTVGGLSDRQRDELVKAFE